MRLLLRPRIRGGLYDVRSLIVLLDDSLKLRVFHREGTTATEHCRPCQTAGHVSVQQLSPLKHWRFDQGKQSTDGGQATGSFGRSEGPHPRTATGWWTSIRSANIRSREYGLLLLILFNM